MIVKSSVMARSAISLTAVVHLFLLVVLPTPTQQHGDHDKHAHLPQDGPDNKFHDERVVRDKEHIEEHLREEFGYNSTEELSDDQAEFYYFKMHDLNNDTALDGLEILSALTHMLPYEELYSKTGEKETEEGEKQFKTAEELKAASDKRKQEAMDYYTTIIDQVLKDDDHNDDGYLSYLEYMKSRRKETGEQAEEPKTTIETPTTKGS